MKGYYEGYSYVGYVNGKKMRFATEQEYKEYLEERSECYES